MRCAFHVGYRRWPRARPVGLCWGRAGALIGSRLSPRHPRRTCPTPLPFRTVKLSAMEGVPAASATPCAIPALRAGKANAACVPPSVPSLRDGTGFVTSPLHFVPRPPVAGASTLPTRFTRGSGASPPRHAPAALGRPALGVRRGAACPAPLSPPRWRGGGALPPGSRLPLGACAPHALLAAPAPKQFQQQRLRMVRKRCCYKFRLSGPCVPD